MTCRDCAPLRAEVLRLQGLLDGRTMKVYFAGNEQYVKIGHAMIPAARVRNLNGQRNLTWRPVDLFEYGDVGLWWVDPTTPETVYHDMFEQYRVPCVGRRRNGEMGEEYREWFLAEPVREWLQAAGVI